MPAKIHTQQSLSHLYNSETLLPFPKRIRVCSGLLLYCLILSRLTLPSVSNTISPHFSFIGYFAAAAFGRRAFVTKTASLFLVGNNNNNSPYKISSSTALRAMSSITRRDGSGTIIVAPKNIKDQTALIVIAHGLGDTAEGFADVAEQLAQKLPYVKFVLPTAPTQPVTMNMGMSMPSWYDIKGLDERSNEQCNGIEESRERLAQILADEHAKTQLPYSRMVLAGFSQGGALSLYTGLQLPAPTDKVNTALAGVVVMSGYLPHAQQFQITPGLENVPVWHGHGNMDGMVNIKAAERSKAHVTERGLKADYTLKTYPIAHTVSPTELQDVVAFLERVLPPDDSVQVQLPDPSSMSVKELRAAVREAGLQNRAVGFMEKSEFVKLLKDHYDGKA